ncbi:hypothetical protein CYMTET_43938 [Cymbomonas tetramitiformis]|uniref:Uncharacterized protein n=1 Tax=Cymbomonas tetramitiformis TaxID=36881 RepID=A0AAE0C170_9CHLO|nr:hypothetical protein CYMTET_43938 [Cymbomonas tetramitiformis]
MDTSTLATRIEELRASEVLRGFLERSSRGRRAVRAAHASGPAVLQRERGGPKLFAKLDELLAANGPPRRTLPGAACDFKDKNGSDGMSLCEDKAQLARIAFKDGWNMAKCFADEPVTNSEEAEKRYKKAKKAASEEAAANADSMKARNGWKARGGWRPQQYYQPPPQPRNDFGPKGGK